jgi:hypothetical protein
MIFGALGFGVEEYLYYPPRQFLESLIFYRLVMGM